jgi:cytochrome c peroxidase
MLLMKCSALILCPAFLCLGLFVMAARADAGGEQTSSTQKSLAPLPNKVPTPADNPTTAAKVSLGKQLFFDPRLSGDNKMSCATCHLPDKAYGDGLATAEGNGGKQLARNSQTVLNTAFLDRLFWDGRAASLEEQALGPIESPDEMNQKLDVLETELNSIPGYVEQFQDVFKTPVTRSGIAKSLATFQRTIVTSAAPLDRYLNGDKTAISDAAKRGLELFTGDAGCIRCHNGPMLSDGKFYRLGIASQDKGRGTVTGKREDDYKFRTPPLRNIAETGPYMHNGSLKTLDEVVMFYYRGGPSNAPDGQSLDVEALVGQSFSEIPDLVAFLKSLTGETPEVQSPKLP